MEDNKKILKAALLLAIAVAAFTLAAVYVGFSMAGGKGSPDVADPVVADQVETVKESDEKAMPAEGDGSTIKIPGFDVMRLRAGTFSQECDLLYNPAENDCAMIFSLFLPNGTPFYQSGLIQPGQHLEVLELSAKLAAGTYPEAVLRYNCYDASTFEPLNGAEVKFTLEVIE